MADVLVAREDGGGSPSPEKGRPRPWRGSRQGGRRRRRIGVCRSGRAEPAEALVVLVLTMGCRIYQARPYSV